jgi:hypothetical protein
MLRLHSHSKYGLDFRLGCIVASELADYRKSFKLLNRSVGETKADTVTAMNLVQKQFAEGDIDFIGDVDDETIESDNSHNVHCHFKKYALYRAIY